MALGFFRRLASILRKREESRISRLVNDPSLPYLVDRDDIVKEFFAVLREEALLPDKGRMDRLASDLGYILEKGAIPGSLYTISLMTLSRSRKEPGDPISRDGFLRAVDEVAEVYSRIRDIVVDEASKVIGYNATVLTYGYSSFVKDVLVFSKAKVNRVISLDQSPLLSGRKMVLELRREGLKAIYYPDMMAMWASIEADMVLVEVLGVSEGHAILDIGALPLVETALSRGIPVYLVTNDFTLVPMPSLQEIMKRYRLDLTRFDSMYHRFIYGFDALDLGSKEGVYIISSLGTLRSNAEAVNMVKAKLLEGQKPLNI